MAQKEAMIKNLWCIKYFWTFFKAMHTQSWNDWSHPRSGDIPDSHMMTLEWPCTTCGMAHPKVEKLLKTCWKGG